MKEIDFVMKMIATFEALNLYSDEKETTRYYTKDERKVTQTFKLLIYFLIIIAFGTLLMVTII